MKIKVNRRCSPSFVALIVTAIAGVVGALSPAIAAESLGANLTPVGAEIGANGDGSIPAWVDPGSQAVGWSYGQPRGEHWKFKSDKPLYTIKAENLGQYQALLTPGQIELLKTIPGYQMDVYPTRRSCGIPDFVAENTKKNVGFAALDDAGLALKEAYVPGVPFPIPKNGVEVMVNMKLRYRGVGIDFPQNINGVSPRKGGDWLRIAADTFYYLPWGAKGSQKFSEVGQMEGYYYFSYLQPASLAGQAGVVSLRAGEQMSTFYYFPGQRRVRRMPAFSYDAPQIGLDNQYTVDETAIFSGPLDRFDWKLVGKQELLVPYNAFGAYDISSKLEDFTKDDFIEPKMRRYEKHRVWVVEATVRSGMRHQSPKRLFYVDEDSWSPLAAVDYDAQGKVWKVREGQLIPIYETGACDIGAQFQYNLVDKRYIYDMTTVGARKDAHWIVDKADSPRLNRDFYTSDNLRALSER